jgi:hypothetical protein
MQWKSSGEIAAVALIELPWFGGKTSYSYC